MNSLKIEFIAPTVSPLRQTSGFTDIAVIVDIISLTVTDANGVILINLKRVVTIIIIYLKNK